jgi:YggT family protein
MIQPEPMANNAAYNSGEAEPNSFGPTEPLLTTQDGLGDDLYPLPPLEAMAANPEPVPAPVAKQVAAARVAEAYRQERANRQRRRIERFIGYVVTVIDVFLVIRLALKLFGANPLSPFASFIYAITGPFLLPFQSLFPNPSSGRYTLELTTLVAIILYPVFAWMIRKAVYLYFLHGRRSRQGVTYSTIVEEHDV